MLRWLLPSVALLAAPLRAQTADSVTRAAATITAAEVADYVRPLTADSLRDRATPSPGLERAARYVAAEFQRLGLQPGALPSEGPLQPRWVQRYPIPGQRHVNLATSELWLMARRVRPGQDPHQDTAEMDTAGGAWVQLNLATMAYFAPEVGVQTILPPKRINLFAVTHALTLGIPMAVVAGRQSVASVRQLAAQVRERTVLYVPAADVDSGVRRQIIQALYEATAGVVIVSTVDSAAFAAQAAHRQPVALIDDYLRETVATRPGARRWAVVVWAGAIEPFLTTTGVDLDQLRTDTVPVLRILQAAAACLRPVEPEPPTAAMATAPNVVGILEGTDPKLAQEYVVLTAHLDNRAAGGARDVAGGGVTVMGTSTDTNTGANTGTGPAADTIIGNMIGNAAEDHTASVAALLALANAFSQPGARPRRSLLFVMTSGGAAEGTWGANAFAYQATGFTASRDLVANLTLEPLGRAPGDSVWISGLRDVELIPAPTWVAESHPELGLAVADGGTVVQPGAEPFPFARAVVPSLSLRGAGPAEGAISSGPAAGDTKGVVDARQVARVAQLALYLAHALANAEPRPRWSAEGRRQLRTMETP